MDSHPCPILIVSRILQLRLIRGLLSERVTCVLPPDFFESLWSCRQSFVIFYLMFLEEYPKWSEKLEGYSCMTWSWGYVSIFLAVSLLLTDCLVPLLPVLEDSLKFLDWLTCNCKRCPRKSCTWFLVYVSITSGLFHNRCCLVLKYVFQHLGYLLAMDSHPCPILIVSRILQLRLIRGLLSERVTCVLPPDFFESLWSCRQSFVIFYLMFLEEYPKWSEKLEGYSCMTWSWGYVSIFLAVSLLLTDCLVPLLPVLEDSLKFLDWLTCNCKRCPRKSCTWFLVLSSPDKEILVGFSSFFPTVLLQWTSFLILCGERKINLKETE